jgi:hypothetical protein
MSDPVVSWKVYACRDPRLQGVVVQARTQEEARAVLRRRFRLHHLPPGTGLERVRRESNKEVQPETLTSPAEPDAAPPVSGNGPGTSVSIHSQPVGRPQEAIITEIADESNVGRNG